MQKTFLLTIALILLFGSSVLYADCDCSITEPNWYMEEAPGCQIYPYYYTVDITANASWYDSQSNPPSGSSSGSCTEYWGCISCSYPALYTCKESIHDVNDMWCSLYGNGACYGWWWMPFDCNTEGLSIEGSWDDKTYSGSESYDWSDENDSYHYSSTTSISAEFSLDSVPENCRTEPVVTISDYEATVFVRPASTECVSCGRYSGAQTIGISCSGAAHTKITLTSSGDSSLFTISSCNQGCSGGTHCSSGGITIVPNHNKVLLSNCKHKKATVTYTVVFFDSAGNSIGTGVVNVLLTTAPPPPEPDADSKSITVCIRPLNSWPMKYTKSIAHCFIKSDSGDWNFGKDKGVAPEPAPDGVGGNEPMCVKIKCRCNANEIILKNKWERDSYNFTKRNCCHWVDVILKKSECGNGKGIEDLFPGYHLPNPNSEY